MTPQPRQGHFWGAKIYNSQGKQGTWLEGEAFAYPHGGMTRRCYALCEDGKLRVVRCGIPDTYFSIPAHARIAGKYARGYVYSDEGTFRFQQSKG